MIWVAFGTGALLGAVAAVFGMGLWQMLCEEKQGKTAARTSGRFASNVVKIHSPPAEEITTEPGLKETAEGSPSVLSISKVSPPTQMPVHAYRPENDSL
jgi:hypothetical protein